MTNELAVIHQMKTVAGVFRGVGVSTHTNEMTGMVSTEIECKGIDYERFEVHFKSVGEYEVIVIRNAEMLANKVYDNLNAVEDALRFRIAENK